MGYVRLLWFAHNHCTSFIVVRAWCLFNISAMEIKVLNTEPSFFQSLEVDIHGFIYFFGWFHFLGLQINFFRLRILKKESNLVYLQEAFPIPILRESELYLLGHRWIIKLKLFFGKSFWLLNSLGFNSFLHLLSFICCDFQKPFNWVSTGSIVRKSHHVVM